MPVVEVYKYTEALAPVIGENNAGRLFEVVEPGIIRELKDLNGGFVAVQVVRVNEYIKRVWLIRGESIEARPGMPGFLEEASRIFSDPLNRFERRYVIGVPKPTKSPEGDDITDMVLFNAPRPLYGFHTWTNSKVDWAGGWFFAAINTARSAAHMFIKENLEQDAQVLVFVPEDQFYDTCESYAQRRYPDTDVDVRDYDIDALFDIYRKEVDPRPFSKM